MLANFLQLLNFLFSNIDFVLVLLHLDLGLLENFSLVVGYIVKFLAHLIDLLSLSVIDIALSCNLLLSTLDVSLGVLVFLGELLVSLSALG